MYLMSSPTHVIKNPKFRYLKIIKETSTRCSSCKQNDNVYNQPVHGLLVIIVISYYLRGCRSNRLWRCSNIMILVHSRVVSEIFMHTFPNRYKNIYTSTFTMFTPDNLLLLETFSIYYFIFYKFEIGRR